MGIYSINDVADYIILRLNQDEDYPLINLKLQKLLYYVQAWSLGINKRRVFNARFQAWVHGPVCREVYDRFRDSKTLYSQISKEDVLNPNALSVFDQEDAQFIDYILENYAPYSGTELESMVHKEHPWIEARKSVTPQDRCENEISEETMQEYYGNRWKEINSEP